MKEQALREFVTVLKNRLLGQEKSMETIEKQFSSERNKELYESSKIITQAHINELEFIIEKLEELLDS